MQTQKRNPAVQLLLSDARGIYIPRDFVQDFDLQAWGIDPESWAAQTCQNPDAEGYWDAWNDITDKAQFTDAHGDTFTLYQDGDLWAICYERMTDEEKANFGFED